MFSINEYSTITEINKYKKSNYQLIGFILRVQSKIIYFE